MIIVGWYHYCSIYVRGIGTHLKPSVGYHAGADLRLNDGDMFFLLGGRFTNVGFTTNDDIYVTDKPSLQMINTRIGLGFKLFHLTASTLPLSAISCRRTFIIVLASDLLGLTGKAYYDVNSNAAVRHQVFDSGYSFSI